MYFVAFFSVLTLLFVLRFGRARDIQGSEPEASGSEHHLVELNGGARAAAAAVPPATTYHVKSIDIFEDTETTSYHAAKSMTRT